MASLQKGLSAKQAQGLVSLCPQRDDNHNVLSVLSWCHEWQGHGRDGLMVGLDVLFCNLNDSVIVYHKAIADQEKPDSFTL